MKHNVNGFIEWLIVVQPHNHGLLKHQIKGSFKAQPKIESLEESQIAKAFFKRFIHFELSLRSAIAAAQRR